MTQPPKEREDGPLNPVDLQALALARVRSQAIKEFCANAGIAASVQATGLPDDVRAFRLNTAVSGALAARSTVKEGEDG